MHTTWQLGFAKFTVSDMSGISTAEVHAYVDLLKREDGGKAFLKIMRNFDYSPAFRQRCYGGVQGVPYPIQALWGVEDPGLTFERYGQEIGQVVGLPAIQKLPAKHLLQEDQWAAIADAVTRLASQAGTL
ncbi:MAG: alpha/beta hydrolase fold [uncultured Cytophagales bacterium]|uniref:Alpha/beta hydrolase fold n=1 Tax=uncultured Cytophagales bacterium TaxID=158755 RepID=A0A6J4HMB3_9SPHI|nr:MAG: alpha/beta hydrolase fold [uncultured Cytophagales bacterium]